MDTYIIFMFPVIVEEAAEVLEAHIVASLTHRCQHLILIGKSTMGHHLNLMGSKIYIQDIFP